MLRPLPWNIGFAIGHPDIDAQHRHLIGLINDIIGAVEQKALERLPAMLGVLGDAAAEHFSAEIAALHELRSGLPLGVKKRPKDPRAMKALTDAGIDEHQSQHALLLNRLGGFHALAPPALCTGLKEWFVDHAIRQDASLRPIFQTL